MLVPKLVSVIRNGYTAAQFKADVISGVIVGIVALPLAIAFAIASGVAPERGLVTAVVAGFLISLLGGSRVQIGGPTGAFVVIVYSIIQQHGIEGLIVATLLGGIILVFFGLAGFGGVIKFIPRPVTVAFTSGIAVIIFISQIRDFLGLDIAKLPAEFFEKCAAYFEHFPTVNIYALSAGFLTIAIILLWQHFVKRIPGAIVAMVSVTAITYIFKWPVETIGSAFGDIPNKIPAPVFPHVSVHMISSLIAPAFTIAILSGMESLMSAVVADGMMGGNTGLIWSL